MGRDTELGILHYFCVGGGSLTPHWRMRPVKGGIEKAKAFPRTSDHRMAQQVYYKCRFLIRASDSRSGGEVCFKHAPSHINKMLRKLWQRESLVKSVSW